MAGAPIVVVVDDTLFRRWGAEGVRRVLDPPRFWHRDPQRARPWQPRVIAGILGRWPFCAHPACCALLRLARPAPRPRSSWRVAASFWLLAPGVPAVGCIHVVGDAAYHGKALLVERHYRHHPAAGQRRACYEPPDLAPADAAAPGPRATGSAPRPTSPRPRTWRQVTVSRYGRRDTV